MKILLATPCAQGVVRYEYCQSILTQVFNHPERLANQERYQVALYLVGGYSGLGKDRGIIASYALREGFDKLVFIDSDQKFYWNQFKALVDSDKPVVAGVIALKDYPQNLNFTPNVDDLDCFIVDQSRITPNGLKILKEKHEKDEIPVQCMGTGFMSIDVAVLMKLSETCPTFYHVDVVTKERVKVWDFFQTGVVNGLYFGEDWAFCAQAKRAGFQSYINASVLVDHIGSHNYKVGSELNIG